VRPALRSYVLKIFSSASGDGRPGLRTGIGDAVVFKES
jgi:hypothetical protein